MMHKRRTYGGPSFDADGVLAALKVHYPPRAEAVGVRGLCRLAKIITSRQHRSTARGYRESYELRKVTCLRCLRLLAERGMR